MASDGITIGGTGGSGGVTVGNIWVPTESGLQSSGFLDRLQAAMDNRAQYQGVLSGLAPALQASGVPVQAPQGILGQALSMFGIGGQQQQPQIPTATSSQAGGSGASAPTMSAPNLGGGGAPQPMSYAPTGGGTPTGDALIPAISQLAQKHGLDPLTTIRAVRAESGANPAAVGDNGSSFGLLQLHYGNIAGGGNSGAGMGDDYTAATGRDARDPANAMDALDYALGRVSKEGWGAFHGAINAGIGQWDGIGGARGGSMPSQAAAYTSGDSSGQMPRAPAVEALNGAAPMPIARSGPGAQQTPQSAMPRGQPGAPPDAQASAGVSGSAPTSPGAVLAPLMSNPATRPVGAQLWQNMLKRGGGAGGLQLPGGMTPDALAQMIATPQTMQMGLGIWEKALFPGITSIEPNRAVFRGTQYLGQTPSAPTAVPLDSRLVDPNTRQVIVDGSPKLEHGEVGRDPYGQPIQGSINPQTGVATPFQGGQGQGAAPATDANGQPLSGPAFLGTLPPALGNQVQAIAAGRMKLPSGMSAANPMAQRLRAAVLQFDPSFDQAGVDARFDTRADFAKGDAAKTITAGNTALIHLGELASRVDALGNADTSIPGNNAYNWAKNSANASSAAGAPITAFNTIASKYSEEATKFYRGSGGTEADIGRDIANLNANMSPTQLKAAIQAQVPLLQGKVAAMQDRWHQGMGPKAGDYPILSPEAQEVVSRLGPQAGAGYGAPAANLPVAAPTGGGGAPNAGGATRTLRGTTYTQGPDGHWYTGQ